MDKAMYLVDETGLAQYNTLKEKGFYSNIMGTSAVFSIFCDSIKFDKEKMEFMYYGKQRRTTDKHSYQRTGHCRSAETCTED